MCIEVFYSEMIQGFPSFLMVTDLYFCSYQLKAEPSNTVNGRDKAHHSFFTVPYQRRHIDSSCENGDRGKR